MSRFLKALIGLFLLPVAWSGIWTLGRVVVATGRAQTFWIAFGTGAAMWLLVYLRMPRPLWLYVVGHELTHALWSLLFGGRVKSFKATRSGGQVVVTRSNFLVVLAPYFFPLYAVLWASLFWVVRFFMPIDQYAWLMHLGLGGAYAFHASLTVHVLRHRQSDITSEGVLFAAPVICIAHVAVLILALPLLTGVVSPGIALQWWWKEVWKNGAWLVETINRSWHWNG